MKTAELIETAYKCGERGADCKNCPLNGRHDCLQYLARLMADELDRVFEKPLCVPGDKVYQVSDGEVFESTVQKVIFDCGHIAFEESAIGKIVFLTKEEAVENIG